MAIVKNNSKGYGYNYASLSDIASQGFEIPKMKTESFNEKEYVCYYDKEINEWIRGAEIVVPDGKGMNKAQLYGSALTYARRYTTLMALCLCCGDDNVIENLNADGTSKEKVFDENEIPATEKQMEIINNLSNAVKENIMNHYQIGDLEELSKAQASEVISKVLKRK